MLDFDGWMETGGGLDRKKCLDDCVLRYDGM